uniref:Uncharacterized protein n=1 Tax=Cacopsylla melanoneura TaxID=428564 RepID=A0A8D9BJF9_9HEMI
MLSDLVDLLSVHNYANLVKNVEIFSVYQPDHACFPYYVSSINQSSTTIIILSAISLNSSKDIMSNEDRIKENSYYTEEKKIHRKLHEIRGSDKQREIKKTSRLEVLLQEVDDVFKTGEE